MSPQRASNFPLSCAGRATATPLCAASRNGRGGGPGGRLQGDDRREFERERHLPGLHARPEPRAAGRIEVSLGSDSWRGNTTRNHPPICRKGSSARSIRRRSRTTTSAAAVIPYRNGYLVVCDQVVIPFDRYAPFIHRLFGLRRWFRSGRNIVQRAVDEAVALIGKRTEFQFDRKAFPQEGPIVLGNLDLENGTSTFRRDAS